MLNTSVIGHGARVQWGPAITGALVGFAVAVVLGLFGAAFGAGGLRVLSGVWEILTPFVATFVGASVAVSTSGSRGAYLNGIMVWCMDLAFGALIVAILATTGNPSLARSSGALALTGLAAILGLIGAVVGAEVTAAIPGGRAAFPETEQSGEYGQRAPGNEAHAHPAHPDSRSEQQPSMH